MSTAKKVLSNTITQVAGRVFMAILSIFIVKIITTYLGLEGYGKYAAVYEFLAFFGIAADLGLFTIAVREMAKEDDRSKKDSIFANILTLRMTLCVIIMTCATFAAYLIPQYRDIHFGIVIASVAVFLSILQSSLSSILQLNLKMHYAALAQVLGKMSSLFYMIVVVFFWYKEPVDASFYHLIFAGVIGNFVLVLVTFFAARRYGRIRFGRDWPYIKQILLRALPYGTALVLNMIYFRVGSIMLLMMKGPTEVGVYGVPMRVLEILSLVPVFFMNSVLPILTRHIKNQSSRVVDILKYSFDFLFMAAVPMVIGTFVLAYQIIFVISSPEFLSRLDEGFYGSDMVLKLLMVGMTVAFMNSLFIYTLIATNYQNKLLWINGCCAVFNIAMNFFMIPQLGARGAAVTSIATETLLLLLAYLVARKHIKFTFSFKTIWKVLFSGAVMGVCVWALKDPSYGYLQNANVIVLVPIGGIVYGGVLFLTGGISKDLIASIRGRSAATATPETNAKEI